MLHCIALSRPVLLQTRLPEDWQPPARFRNGWSVAGAIFRAFNVAWEAGVTPGKWTRSLKYDPYVKVLGTATDSH